MGMEPGSDFGSEPGGSDFGSEFGDDFGGDFGGDFGYEFGADAATPALADPSHPVNQAKMLALWKSNQSAVAKSKARHSLLRPNEGSTVKVSGYSFSINATIALLGTPQALFLTGTPDTDIKPNRVVMNAPSPGFATIDDIKVANVSGTVGVTGDAFKYSILGVSSQMRLPMLTPSTRATVTGAYTGLLPLGFVGGVPFLFEAAFEGPASTAGPGGN